MPVLDMVCRDVRVTRVTLIEPDVYKPHNVERHLFPLSAVGEPKGELARRWLRERLEESAPANPPESAQPAPPAQPEAPAKKPRAKAGGKGA